MNTIWKGYSSFITSTPGLQERIFVPFFTTKQEGSGIGLSISQEIMKLHKGSLMVMSMDAVRSGLPPGQMV
ncbi:MAG TPA: ATP-binding protein [Bacteroidales bacterium]|nr:ATP-binding protein [Bacteroidales bacterium]